MLTVLVTQVSDAIKPICSDRDGELGIDGVTAQGCGKIFY